jgi:signal transduction histidine kinase
VTSRLNFISRRQSTYPVSLADKLIKAGSRYRALLLLLLVCCGVAVIGVFVIRDLHAADVEAQAMYTGSVHGLQRIGELQYDAQETRRATLYALTTSDSNLQVDYADQSRNADQRVKDGIAEYAQQAKLPGEVALAKRLTQDWAGYLSVRDEVLASILEGSTREAVNLDLSGGVPAFELVRQDLNQVKQLYDQDASQRLANLGASWRRSSWKLVGILVFTFILSGTAVWAVQRGQMLNAIHLAKLQMEFVASVSHELRTPVAVMSSAADNLADGLIEGRPALQKYGALLQKQSRRMGELVDEILLFAATEDHENRYVLKPLDISPIVESIVASSEALVQGTDVAIRPHIEPHLPMVMGDPVAISQCLQNLVGNAIKYGGDHPRITIRVFSAPAEHAVGEEVRISVADRGIGIDPSELSKIFDPFYRSPSVNAAQIHGTGLGLSLAKRIAESMGARLTVVSELSVGSTFTLHFRNAKEDDLQAAAATSRPATSARI